MGVSKSEQFTKRQNELAKVLKALGHPARIAIMEYLLEMEGCICGDIVDELPLAQPTVSQHLKELKNAGLIQGSIEGRAICYCVNQEMIENLEKYLGGLVTQVKLKTNCC